MNRSAQLALGLFLCVAGGAVVLNLPGLTRARVKAPAEPADSKVVHLTTAGFPALQAQAKPVVMDFWAPWCGPCRTQGPILEAFAAQVGDQAVVAKINVDEEQALAAQFQVSAIPTLIILKNGQVSQRLVGVHSAEDLRRALAEPGA